MNMKQVLLIRIGSTNNFYAADGGHYYNIFHHIGWKGILCLTVDRIHRTYKYPNYSAIPLHHNNCCGGTGDDQYTARFFDYPYNGESRADVDQLIAFVKEHFEIELVFPE